MYTYVDLFCQKKKRIIYEVKIRWDPDLVTGCFSRAGFGFGFFPKVVSGSAFFSRRLELDPVFFSKGRIPVKSTQIRHPEYKILN